MDRFTGHITEHLDDPQDVAARVWHSHYRAELGRRQEAQRWARRMKRDRDEARATVERLINHLNEDAERYQKIDDDNARLRELIKSVLPNYDLGMDK